MIRIHDSIGITKNSCTDNFVSYSFKNKYRYSFESFQENQFKVIFQKKKYFRKLMLFLFKYTHVNNSMTRLWIKTCEGFGEIKTKKIERMKVLIEII